MRLVEAVGEYWSNLKVAKDAEGTPLKTRWWQHAQIIRHINRTVCGKAIDGFSAGLNVLASRLLEGQAPLQKAISVGGGTGVKEIKLVRDGIVKSIEVFEVARARIAAGEKLARAQHLEHAVHFVCGDAFELRDKAGQYDLVHWNNALHHMPDVEAAIQWSWKVLRTGGLFYMDDFVGPSRFQWTPQMLLVASAVRQALPARLLVNPRNSSALLPRIVKKVDAEKLRQSDPSEAADSDRIIPYLKERFPHVSITQTGGVIYSLALSDLLANFACDEDWQLLDRLLIVDDMCTAMGITLYAAALALKT